MTTRDIHKADVAATEGAGWTREDYCRLVGELVGNLASMVEPIGPSVVNALAETPGRWETMLGHLLSGRGDNACVARQIAEVLRRHAFAGVATAAEQGAYRLGYRGGYVTEADRAAGEATLAEFFGTDWRD